ncbi:DUF1501 domain-containing protein [Rhodopirellula sp.]|nr:DUF1501 domain-containing protein [Rhodopirellula sp.]MDB4477081.1 DUF1501 domain-containing protein [Rhodopirellula sp.]
MSTKTTLDRRSWLSFASSGVGSIALADLMSKDSPLHADSISPESPDPAPHHRPRAKRVIHICMFGGLSQVDSFDYKPELTKLHGKSLSSDEKPDVFFGKIGLLRKSDWKFQQRGQNGLWVSDLFPHLGQVADELTVVNSMFAETSNHTPATFQENTGFRLNGFPTFGAWMSYGMGSETDELPSYLVIPDTRGLPAGGSINWSNGFLPARHQGVIMRSKGKPVNDLFPPKNISAIRDLESRHLLNQINRKHFNTRGTDDELAARIASYGLAAKMQMAVPEVTDLTKESESTYQMYGLENPETMDFGRSCLLARRLLEKGVRFVQLYSGGAFGSPRINWDGHENMKQNHGREAGRADKPLAGLIQDLRQRGMLDDTIVICTSEFGRTPFTQSASDKLGIGRDHNQNGFSIFMAGAKMPGGRTYGSTDEIGWQATEQRTSWPDLHANLLHLLGIDHQRLTYYHNGIQRRLTNVHGSVLPDLIG